MVRATIKNSRNETESIILMCKEDNFIINNSRKKIRKSLRAVSGMPFGFCLFIW